MDQLESVGDDTTMVISYLGTPNYIERQKDEKIYYYYLECGEKDKTSYDNFYCYFRSDTLWYYQYKTF